MFEKRRDFRESKSTCSTPQNISNLVHEVSQALQSHAILDLLQDITDIQGLIPDPRLSRGGLSLMTYQDYLNPHIDNSHDIKRINYRRLNLLYYVSPQWQEEYGGNLQLWDSRCVTPLTITSFFNRLVVMETNKSSWHSVTPVTSKRYRCCISSYCYTSNSFDNSNYYHVTSFKPRQDQSKALALICKADSVFRRSSSFLTRLMRK